MTTVLPPSPFLTESPESVETASRVSTVVEAAATIEPPLAAAADYNEPIFGERIPDKMRTDDIHEIFHHARQLVAESRRQAEIDRHGLAAVEREISIWQRGAGAEYMQPVDVPLFLR
jgi:hypothetical protein